MAVPVVAELKHVFQTGEVFNYQLVAHIPCAGPKYGPPDQQPTLREQDVRKYFVQSFPGIHHTINVWAIYFLKFFSPYTIMRRKINFLVYYLLIENKIDYKCHKIGK
jgi:hypothetical protein